MIRRLTSHAPLAAAAVLVACAGAFADAGYYVNKSGAPLPENEDGEPEIRMAAEEVTISLRDHYVDVAASFDFVNDGDEGRTVGMYFPLNVGTLELTAEAAQVFHDPEIDSYGYDLTADRVKSSFKAVVDGVPADHELRDIHCASDGFFDEVTADAVWEVAFEPGETKRVDCSYSCYYNSGYMSYASGSFFYIVYTGTAWKGPIGRGVITIRPGEGFDWSRPLDACGVDMPPMHVHDDRIAWRFDDFEPVLPEVESYATLDTGSGIALHVPPTLDYYGDTPPPEGRDVITGLAADQDIPIYREPSVTADLVDGPAFIAEEGLAGILERRGEWYRVRYVYPAGNGVEGWVRWYEYDDEAGEARYSFQRISSYY